MCKLSYVILALTFSVQVLAIESFIDPKVFHNKFGSYYVLKGHDHRPAVARLKKGQVHELQTLQYISQIYPEGTSIIHAGAYYGDMLPFFSKLVGKNTVWAFEPVRNNYLCAKANIELNKLKNVKLHNMGLSAKKNQLPMITKKGSVHQGGASRILAPGEETKHTIESVDVDSIDHILEDNHAIISIIHLDIEGHERQALQGAMATIAKYSPILILEVFKNQEKAMHAFLDRMGYKFEKRVDKNCIYFPKKRRKQVLS